MFPKIKLSKSLKLSLTLHIVILTVVFVGVGFSLSKPQIIEVNLQKDAPEQQQIVKAGIVDKKAVDDAYQRQLLAEKQRLQKLAEEKRQADQLKEEAEKLKKEKDLAQQALKIANAKKAQVEAQAREMKAAQEKAKKELVKQQEQAKAVIKQQQEQTKKQEAARKAAAIKAEQDKIRAQRDSFIANEMQRYMAEFAQAIEDNRILSSVFAGDLRCKIRIQLLPNGSILSASIVESSGNPAYDDMSKNAVFKTAPFAMPEDKDLYDKLRDIVLSFRNGEQDAY